MLTRDTTLLIKNFVVEIIQPTKEWQADLLVLPGWNYGRHDWGNKTDLFRLAQQKGYRLILPEMKKSLYTIMVYPETRTDWKNYPTLLWLTDTVIPHLQSQYNIFSTRANYIIGLSTGAKGGALVALRTDTLFSAAVLLSGDYDLTLQKDDVLNIGFLGNYTQFPERWQGANNPIDNLFRLKTAFYIGHGKQDNVVPAHQSINFYEAIQRNLPNPKAILSINDTAGHNYGYWNSELVAAFRFFE